MTVKQVRSRRRDSPPTGQRPPKKRRRNYARWRALSLSLVYVVFAVHIVHWKITGKTLAPLELNEVMYTLELGIITAGFLFMCFLVFGTLIFGRFFCSWACHIMVLQDLCAWVLRKFRIRRKPIRSRVLLLVPPLTAAYMFLWPQIVRAWQARAFPEFHFRTDAQGWASFATTNFWRNLPSAPIIVLTFLVCGFLIVYLLGSRTFCTYVCPYGAIFALADRFAPGRIRLTAKCKQCGTCTDVCTTGVRVHEEVKQHGMIVNPACLKDLDCVSACPQSALHYGFTRPALLKSYASGGRFGLPYDFTWAEDILAALVFLVVVVSFRGLYSRIPFLLSLALGGIIAYLIVNALRVLVRSDVEMVRRPLRQAGRLTLMGRAYLAFTVALTAFIAHSGFVRYHEYTGLHGARALATTGDAVERDAVAAASHARLLTADRWGLIKNERVEQSLVDTSMHLERYGDAATYARRFLARHPYDGWVRLSLGRALLARNEPTAAERAFRTIIRQQQGMSDAAVHVSASAHQALAELLRKRGDAAGAVGALRAAVELEPAEAALHAALGSLQADLGRFREAEASLREAVRLDPALGDAHYNLGTLLGFGGRFEEAIGHYRQAAGLASGDDPELHNNFGFALMRVGKLDESRGHLERAIEIDPDHADAHFNLGSLFASQQRIDAAQEHFAIAARLEPRYARILGTPPSE